MRSMRSRDANTHGRPSSPSISRPSRFSWLGTRRLYHYDQNRWISPDPAGLSAVDPSDPQTWNRYSYGRGNPLAAIDPSGLTSYCPWGTIPGQNVCAGPPTSPCYSASSATPPAGCPGSPSANSGNGQGGQNGGRVGGSTGAGPNKSTCKTGLGAGITLSADAVAGLGYGAGANGSVGAGVFGGNGVNAGAFASGGAGASAFGHGASAPSANLIGRFFAGLVGGAGGGIFLTNASQAGQLYGPSGTWNVDFGDVINGAAQFSAGTDTAGNSIWSFSFTLGVGLGVGYHHVTNKTVTAGRKGGC